jgi:TRAP-type C4-dicarboxylate transport system substrate-binding protein
MKLIVNPKTKKEEKAVKNFLTSLDIDFQTRVEEEAAPYRTRHKKIFSQKEKKILNNLDKSVDFVNKYKRGKAKTKSLNQLLNEL